MSSPAPQPRTRVPRLAQALRQEAAERARLHVVPVVRSRAPRLPFVVLVSLLLLGGVVGLLLFNTSMQQASFTATALEKQADSLAAREQTLQMELGELRNPQRVAAQAQQMGMVIPTSPVFLDLEDGTVSGTRTPSTREHAIALEERRAPVEPAVLAPQPAAADPAAAAPGQMQTQTQARRARTGSGRR